jgi:hypothetical protein
MLGKLIARDDLNALMEFDHPIRVHADGSVSDGLANVYAPSLMDEHLDSPDWEFFSTGYTGQYGYRGPIMHDSEFIGGRLADDILAAPGIYCAVVADWSPEDGAEDGDNFEGWAVVRLKGSES